VGLVGQVGLVGKARRSYQPDVPDPSHQLDPPDLPAPPGLGRRDFLSAALLLPAFARQTSGERFISTVALGNPGGAAPPPFGRLLGDGLDARLFTDLSTLGQPESSTLTATEKFFVRTAAPSNLPPTDGWKLRIGGRVSSSADLHLRDLESLVSPSRRVLIEC